MANNQKVELWIIRGSFDRTVKRELRTRSSKAHAPGEVYVTFSHKEYPLKDLTPAVTAEGSLVYLLKV